MALYIVPPSPTAEQKAQAHADFVQGTRDAILDLVRRAEMEMSCLGLAADSPEKVALLEAATAAFGPVKEALAKLEALTWPDLKI